MRVAGRPERFSRGWAYSGVKSHGDEWRGSGESYFRRTRRHPVYAMGDGEATALLDRLRAKDLAERNKTDDERRREREALHLINREAQA